MTLQLSSAEDIVDLQYFSELFLDGVSLFIDCLSVFFQGAVITVVFSRVGDLFASGGADSQVDNKTLLLLLC